MAPIIAQASDERDHRGGCGRRRRVRRLRFPWAVAVLAAAVGCGSTTGGSGHLASASRSVPAKPALPPAVRPTTGAPPGAVRPPPLCATPDCPVVASRDLGSGYRLAALGNTSALGGAGVAVLELTHDGTPVYWRVFPTETPVALVCATSTHLPNCVLVDYAGAHGGVGYPILFVDRGVWVGNPVDTDTPILRAADLDGDGLVDAYGLQNDYEPSYADGAVQWQTWRRTADGTSFTSTGCGPLVHRGQPRAPDALLGGGCA
jgi:hypothetical protein